MRNNKFKLLVLFILFNWLGNSLFAQLKFNYTWVSGLFSTYTIKYNGNEMVFEDSVLSLNYVNFSGGNNICDSNGNVILMSNGCSIFNNSKSIILNGDSLGGKMVMNYYWGRSPYSQSCIFLPFENNLYYFINSSVSDSIFIQEWINGSFHAPFNLLNYSKIDMNLNGGLGGVSEREISLLPDTVNLSKSQMMACKHANGKDWWLAKQAENQNLIYMFLFTKDSVFNFGTQSFSEPKFTTFNQSGQSAFSQDGTKYATTCRGAGKVFLADFDRCTGIFSNPKVYNVPDYNANNPLDSALVDNLSNGLSFSPNGNYLYISKYSNIVQLDLNDNDSNSMWYHVIGFDTTWDNFQLYGIIQLGPDNKIYIGNSGGNGSNGMSRIDNPNLKGSNCAICKKCLKMPGTGIGSPPCMPNYNLGASQPCWPLSTSDIKEQAEIIFYPNPVKNIATIRHSFKGAVELRIEIYDNAGRKVKVIMCKDCNVETSFDLSGFSNGLYSYKVIQNNSFVKVGKFDIIK